MRRDGIYLKYSDEAKDNSWIEMIKAVNRSIVTYYLNIQQSIDPSFGWMTALISYKTEKHARGALFSLVNLLRELLLLRNQLFFLTLTISIILFLPVNIEILQYCN